MADRICSVPGCEKKFVARDLCEMHYRRLRAHGNVGSAEPLTHPFGTFQCSIESCNVASVACGMCQRHYTNLRRHGHAVPIRELPIFEQVTLIGWDVTDTGCWEWRGALNDQGYALYGHRRVSRIMLRLSAVEPLLVRHKCDNPPCVNPDHLELGTDADNSADMVKRGRHYMHGRTECVNGHDLTEPGALKVVARKGRPHYSTCVLCERARKLRFLNKKGA